MDYRELGRTGLKISSLCLGTMTFGEQNSEADGQRGDDCAVERGINIFGCAETDRQPPKPETEGPTEADHRQLARRARDRDKVMIRDEDRRSRQRRPWLRKDGAKTRQSAAKISEAVEASLEAPEDGPHRPDQAAWPGPADAQLLEADDYPHLEGDTHSIDEDRPGPAKVGPAARSALSDCPTRRLGGRRLPQSPRNSQGRRG